jgi:phosphoribosylformylglycinamidine synthase
MAIASGHGLEIDLRDMPVTESDLADSTRLFAESPTRFLVEVTPDNAPELEKILRQTPHARIGRVLDSPRLRVWGDGGSVIDANIATLRSCWQTPLAEATA